MDDPNRNGNPKKDDKDGPATGGIMGHATNAFNSATKGLSNLFGNGEGADEQKPASSPETMLPKINNASGPSGGRRPEPRRGRKGKRKALAPPARSSAKNLREKHATWRWVQKHFSC